MRSTPNNQAKHAALLVLLACGMFGFAFALVPLYDVFCELTGLNGKTAGPDLVVEVPAVIIDREVKIQLLAHVGKGLPWEFRPTSGQLNVRPGEMVTTTFYARNHAGAPVTGQAVPSVTPGLAAAHLHKVECFCFEQQLLTAGEEVLMPVTFYVDADLPATIGTLSLSYSMFRVADADAVGETAKIASNWP